MTAVMYANTDISGLLSDGRLVSGSPVGATGRENIFAGDRRTSLTAEGLRCQLESVAGGGRTSLTAGGFRWTGGLR